MEETPMPSIDERFVAALEALAKAGQGSMTREEFIEASAEAQARANKKVLRPENDITPEISAFSYPEGDTARPKPKLQKEIYWIGYRLREEELRPIEIDLFNRLQPGHYHGKQWIVRGNDDDTGHVRSLKIEFPNQSLDDRMELPASMESMLLEMVEGIAAKTDPIELLARIRALEAEVEILREAKAAGLGVQ